MAVELAKTFLEIVNTGSFVRAADRLNVTQTTVSARVRSLESKLGRRLFVRNKAGALLTDAGKQFLRYAPTFVQIWQRACHQVAIPEGRRALLAIGSEVSLWNPLLLNWMLRMKEDAPDIALRTEVSLSDDLMSKVAAGVLNIAIMYRPQNLPGLRIEEILREKLVLVTTDGRQPVPSDYVYVDWGPRFVARHDMSFPDLAHPGLYVSLGPLGLSYILSTGGSGYFRMRTARPFLKSGHLQLVRGAPQYSYPVYATYPIASDDDMLEGALKTLREVASTESDVWPIEAMPHSEVRAALSPKTPGANQKKPSKLRYKNRVGLKQSKRRG